MSEIEKLRAEVKQLKHWICHNGGLIDEWANEWNPSDPVTLVAHIENRLAEALKGQQA